MKFLTSLWKHMVACLISVFLISSQASGQLPARTTIAVLDLVITGGIPESYQTTLSTRLNTELFRTNQFIVVERNNMMEILNEQGFQMSGCTSNECAVEAGHLLGVQQMVAGTIGRVGRTISVSVRVIDVETGAILDIQNIDYVGEIDEILSEHLRTLARRLAGLESESEIRGVILVRANVDAGTLSLNGVPTEVEFPYVLRDLPEGLHHIEVSAEDYHSAAQDVVIEEAQRYRVELTLVRHHGDLNSSGLPPGTDIFVDGDHVGVAPCDNIPVGVGVHTVQLRHSGFRNGDRQPFEMTRGAILTVGFELQPKSRNSILKRSLLWPGRGQFYAERPVAGWIYTLGTLGSIGYLALNITDYNTRVQEYNDAKLEYDRAISADDIQRTYTAKELVYSEAEDAQTQVLVASAILGGIYLWNLLDAVLFGEGWEDQGVYGETEGNEPQIGLIGISDSGGNPSVGINIGVTFDLTRRAGQ